MEVSFDRRAAISCPSRSQEKILSESKGRSAKSAAAGSFSCESMHKVSTMTGITPSSGRAGPPLGSAQISGAAGRRNLCLRRSDDGRLLPPGLPVAAAAPGQCPVLRFRPRGGASRVPALPSMPAGSRFPQGASGERHLKSLRIYRGGGGKAGLGGDRARGRHEPPSLSPHLQGNRGRDARSLLQRDPQTARARRVGPENRRDGGDLRCRLRLLQQVL